MLTDITLQAIVMRALSVVIIATLQGGAIAAVAVALGDPGPRYDDRLTLNPAAHIDVIGAVGIILFGFGWSRPVAVDAGEMRWGRPALVLVVLAPAFALLAAAVALRLVAAPALALLPVSQALTSAVFLDTAAALCLTNALFNLLPVYPLSGSHLLGALGVTLPGLARRILPLVLLVVVATGLARDIVAPASNLVSAFLFGRS